MSIRPDVALEVLLRALEQELLEVTDEEILAAAHELGMNPSMKGSAAFIGVKDVTPQLVSALQKAYAARRREAASASTAASAASAAEDGREGEPGGQCEGEPGGEDEEGGSGESLIPGKDFPAPR